MFKRIANPDLMIAKHSCSAAGAWVVANGRRVLNMVSLNFLGVAGDPVIMVRSHQATDSQKAEKASSVG